MIRIFVLAALGLCTASLAGCSGADAPPPPVSVEASAETKASPTPTDETCQDHEAGCPCDEPGQVVDCGRIKRIEGNYVWCATGHQTCTMDGEWGQCTGDQIDTSTGS
ncbi:MAG TPA: hypothetical protein VHV51_02465 [Polyangiaceae bacterium]|jgi:hypothetical protein|nr:hypothetical protein [Polyangiaceae bacterium]